MNGKVATRKSRTQSTARRSVPHMTQPESMKTKAYVYGVERLNGYDAWALFRACAASDVKKVKALLRKDRRLVNAQFWYEFPIHMAVREGNAEILKLLLDHGADILAKDEFGWTAEKHAAKKGRSETAAMLRDAAKAQKGAGTSSSACLLL